MEGAAGSRERHGQVVTMTMLAADCLGIPAQIRGVRNQWYK